MKKKDFDALDLAGGNQAEAVDPVVVAAWRAQFEEEREMILDGAEIDADLEEGAREEMMRRGRRDAITVEDHESNELAELFGGMGIERDRSINPIEAPALAEGRSVLTVQRDEVKRRAEDAFDNDSEEEDSGVATTPEAEALRTFYAAWPNRAEGVEDAEEENSETRGGKKRRVQVEDDAPEEGADVEPTGSAAPNPVLLGEDDNEFGMELSFPLGVTVGGRDEDDSALGESVVTVAETPSFPDAEEPRDADLLPSFVGGDDDAAGAMLVEERDLTVPDRVIAGTVVFDTNAFSSFS